MKLHWRTYWSEFMGGMAWLPWLGYERSTLPYYFKEITVGWLKWGFSFRWWWR